MRNPGGQASWSGEGVSTIACDSITCRHCNGVVFSFKSPTDPKALGGWCVKCAKPICAQCADRGTCTPWEAQMDAMERADRARTEERLDEVGRAEEEKRRIDARLARDRDVSKIVGG